MNRRRFHRDAFSSRLLSTMHKISVHRLYSVSGVLYTIKKHKHDYSLHFEGQAAGVHYSFLSYYRHRLFPNYAPHLASAPTRMVSETSELIFVQAEGQSQRPKVRIINHAPYLKSITNQELQGHTDATMITETLSVPNENQRTRSE